MPGMTDRDTFAAAALTGLLFHNHKPPKPALWWVEQVFDYADAMLRERAKTNHDAAPAAIAGTPGTGDTDHGASPEAIARIDADRGRTDKADFRPGKGTGDTQEPVAWAVCTPGDGDWSPCFFHEPHAQRCANAIVGEKNVVPLYRSPMLTDAEREAIEFAAAHGETVDAAWRYALRGLLERLG